MLRTCGAEKSTVPSAAFIGQGPCPFKDYANQPRRQSTKLNWSSAVPKRPVNQRLEAARASARLRIFSSSRCSCRRRIKPDVSPVAEERRYHVAYAVHLRDGHASIKRQRQAFLSIALRDRVVVGTIY